MKRTLFGLTTAALMAIGTTSYANTIVAFDNFGGDDLNLTSFTGEAAFSSAGDGFNEYDSGEGAPFALLDDTLGVFTPDTLGIVVNAADGSAYDAFFGAVDTQNGDNSGVITATWVFDVTGSTDLEVSFDIAAMGDFETSDVYTVSVQIDGGTPVSIDLLVDESLTQNYILASGTSVDLDDPMQIGATTLTNVFQTFSTGNLGAGDTVTITVDAQLDGGSEAIALDNVTITNIPEPTSLALLALGGITMLRRRR